jgi:hypothetical protein
MTALFTAFDLTGLDTNVSASLVVGVGILLLFVGWRKIKQVGYSI